MSLRVNCTEDTQAGKSFNVRSDPNSYRKVQCAGLRSDVPNCELLQCSKIKRSFDYLVGRAQQPVGGTSTLSVLAGLEVDDQLEYVR